MFAPPFSPRHSCNSSPWRHRSSHLAGSPSPWRNRSSHLAGSPSPWRHSFNSPSNQASNDEPADDGLSLRISFPSDSKSRVGIRYRHPSLDGDNSLGDDFYRSLDGSSLVDPSVQARAAAAAAAAVAYAAEDPLVRRPSVYENEELGAVDGAVGGVEREETGAGRLHVEVPRDAPLPRLVQSERHLPDIVPRFVIIRYSFFRSFLLSSIDESDIFDVYQKRSSCFCACSVRFQPPDGSTNWRRTLSHS